MKRLILSVSILMIASIQAMEKTEWGSGAANAATSTENQSQNGLLRALTEQVGRVAAAQEERNTIKLLELVAIITREQPLSREGCEVKQINGSKVTAAMVLLLRKRGWLLPEEKEKEEEE